MAKQAGIVFFEGTLGGINFYYRKGVPTARRAGGGFNGKAIKNSPSMVRVRESNSEFAACASVTKHFKRSIFTFLTGFKDGTLHSRLMRLFLQIKDLDTVSERGKRMVGLGFATESAKRQFSAFNITLERSVLFGCDYYFDFVALEFKVDNYSAASGQFPKGTDYMEILVGMVRFDFETLKYTQVTAVPLVINRVYEGTSFRVSLDALPDGEGALFAVVRIAFYQTVNGRGYLFSGGTGFGIALYAS